MLFHALFHEQQALLHHKKGTTPMIQSSTLPTIRFSRLSQISVLCGAFFVLYPSTGCFKWGSRATQSLPEETALSKSYDYSGTVIVVGAGSAGLAAARVLEENNIQYTVLEATENHGGRLQEHVDFADFPIDLGAEWIHNNPEILDILSGIDGLSSDMDLIPYHLESAFSWDGETYEGINQSEQDDFFEFFPEYKFKSTTWYSFVNEHYGKMVSDKIQFNTVVSEIDYSGDDVLVTTTNGDIFQADKVLVTVSIGVLKSGDITFIPTLNAQKIEAFESVEFLQGMKVVMKFSEKFYPDAIDIEVDSGERGYYDMAFKKDTNDHILGFLTTGPSEPYSTLTRDEDILDTALKELDTIFDGKATDTFTGDYQVENWGARPYTRGTWVHGFQIKKSTLKVLNQPLEHKVYFAGEANDPYKQLGVPGAILSGLHTVDRLLLNQD